MTCSRIENGKLPSATLWRIEYSVSGLNPVAFTWSAPTWVKLIQITANWAAVPINSEDFLLWKNHTGTEFDVELRRFDPNALSIKNWVALDQFVFEPAEVATVDYPNTDAQAVGIELYFQQLDR
jgi:hypothetical protein